MKALFLKTLSLVLLCGVLIISSCDDEKDDIRDQAVGEYDYELTIYVLDGGDLFELDSDLTGTFEVTKTNEGFVVEEDGDVVFEATNVASASGGFTFEIESQDVTLSGQEIEIEGYEGVEIGSDEFHGMFESSSRELEAWMMAENVLIEIDGEIYEVTLVFEMVAEKDQ